MGFTYACTLGEELGAGDTEMPDEGHGALEATNAIFGDALATGWSDWSWGAHDLATTSPVAAGTRSIAFTYAAWDGLFLHHAGQSTAGLTDVVVRVHGGTAYGAV